MTVFASLNAGQGPYFRYSSKEPAMRLQYTAVGIQNVSRMAVTRDDYMKDLENLALSMRYAVWNCSLDLPVKLIAVSEGGIGG